MWQYQQFFGMTGTGSKTRSVFPSVHGLDVAELGTQYRLRYLHDRFAMVSTFFTRTRVNRLYIL